MLVALDVAGVLLGLAVVIDAYEQEVGGVIGHLGRVLLALNMVDGRIGILSELQLDDDGGCNESCINLFDDIVVLILGNEVGHVKIDGGVLVQVLFEGRIAGYLQVGEQ